VPLARRVADGVLEIQIGAVGWLSGTISLLIGGFILAKFLALFNYLTPSGRVTVTGRVVEVTPNVTGQIVAIPVKPNVPVKANDENEITLVGMFSQNGFQTIKEGTAVDIVFDNAPGRIYRARITAIPKGTGQGQVAVSGTLARTNALGGATVFGGDLDTCRDEPRPASSGNVEQRHRLCRQRGRDRSPGVDSGVGGFLHGISPASQTRNGQDALKKRASLDCAARFR
jgi:hypothetical protein